MVTNSKNILEQIHHYRFEFKHVTVLFLVLVTFQIIVSLIQKYSLDNFLSTTQTWYQAESAERHANLTTSSIELITENIDFNKLDEHNTKRAIESFDIILTQQLLEQNIDEICIILNYDGSYITLDSGSDIVNYFSGNLILKDDLFHSHEQGLKLYLQNEDRLKSSEEIIFEVQDSEVYNILVPFVPEGEYLGAVFMKNKPDFTIITNEIISSYDDTSIIYSSLILLGLLAMYYISSYTVKERDEAQKLLYEEHEKLITEQIERDKESLFTKRIYHTHHKAEKVMGFIKEDLRSMNDNNIEEIKHRVNKYSNFVSRVIYDMKWYDPPINTIRNVMFNTDVNEVIEFIVSNLFLRLSSVTDKFTFKTNLDPKVPQIHINEFVVWEILEPLIQNSIDHANIDKVKITISTQYDAELNTTSLTIQDNGDGVAESLLMKDEDGIKKIFKENVTIKEDDTANRGYGCYIAYQMTTLRCGWELDVFNNPEGSGCIFQIKIKHS